MKPEKTFHTHAPLKKNHNHDQTKVYLSLPVCSLSLSLSLLLSLFIGLSSETIDYSGQIVVDMTEGCLVRVSMFMRPEKEFFIIVGRRSIESHIPISQAPAQICVSLSFRMFGPMLVGDIPMFSSCLIWEPWSMVKLCSPLRTSKK